MFSTCELCLPLRQGFCSFFVVRLRTRRLSFTHLAARSVTIRRYSEFKMKPSPCPFPYFAVPNSKTSKAQVKSRFRSVKVPSRFQSRFQSRLDQAVIKDNQG